MEIRHFGWPPSLAPTRYSQTETAIFLVISRSNEAWTLVFSVRYSQKRCFHWIMS